MQKGNIRLTVRFGIALLLTASLATGQFNCSIQGIVTDPSGAVVSNATVRVTNVNTGTTRDVTTGADGLYRVLSLGPGTYKAEVTAMGFRSAAHTDIVVGVTETARVDFALQVGGATE